MQNISLIIALLVLAYLTGSIPTSVWVGRLFFKIDIREHGSGNAGATNTMRVLGLRTGLPVLIFDIVKGWVSVMYISFFGPDPIGTEQLMFISILLGIFAVTGHIYPIFAGFRGGKGVATLFGVLLALNIWASLIATGVFVFTLIISKYVSLGSVIAGLSFPIWILLFDNSDSISIKIFSGLVSLLLIVTHRSNLKRLMNGKENKADFLFKTKKGKSG